ncbi:MAG TPA: alpha/beta hydrolase-fold protein [Candidatus Limnocylindrales bacterium]|nr:alpha/beta hydrolase-fold protein [Candidatus Limnocylindrales bacterium]
MSLVSFSWNETDPTHPALYVGVRLIGYDTAENPLPLKDQGDGRWSGEFDLPDDLRTSYQLCPVRDTASPDWDTAMAAGEPDPSPRVERLVVGAYGNKQQSSILEMPGAPPQPWHQRRDDVPTGSLHHVDTGREWPEALDIYTPRAGGQDLTTLLLLDGQAWMKLDVAATFDNLIAEGIVPPLVAAIISYPFGPIRVRALTDPEFHLPYLLDELHPWLAKEFGASTDAADTILSGQSLGGLAAINAGLRAPERIGMVLAQSSSLWWTEGALTGEAVIATAAENPASATRFWFEAGVLENEDLVAGNRRIFEVMKAQGYQGKYREYQGGHDFACWRGGLADGLISLLTSERPAPDAPPARLAGSAEPARAASAPRNLPGPSTA